MIDNGKKIARAMHLTTRSLLSLGIDESSAEDFAFHLAELRDDLSQLLAFGKKAGLGEPLSIEEITSLDEMLRDHTQYHYVNFRRALSKSAKKLRRESST